ncbi:protein cordon-bleu isoform X3 [Cebidichthys violaceus]|uniref:protein cordon-bleu isoform X3 n=1 Tax=Cebidichthys violaceus TaxID=271503 RepID=UPI0035C9D403
MSESSKPPSGKRMKARAPPPPQVPLPAPRHIFRNAVPDGGGASGMDAKENLLRPTVDLQLTLPQGSRTAVTEDGSKALMDLLVELCSRHHLNPALHTLELLSPEGHSLGFKPNALLGSLDVACVLIKEKVWEERVVRRPAPKVPEKTVRLMVNYHGSQKAVVRVNPFVPLQALVPVICDKCEFEPAHVLLLKDSISRHELPLDKSLTELGIKELYVHNQSLDSIHSSTTSLNRAEKKGLLGIFQFSRRKTKTDTTSMDMDDCDDRVIQITDTRSNGLSTASGVPGVEDRPSTLGQSQSVMNLPRMSPKAEAKKRRAPALPGAPTPSMGHASCEGYETGLGSESQQRKRKAPAPPPTPASISPDPDDTSASASPTPESPAAETPAPAFRNKAVQSNTVSAAAVVAQAVKPVPLKTTVNPSPARAASPTPSSPTPSSSTTESLSVRDSSSELGHSLDDSDADLDQAASYCSTLTSSAASGSVKSSSRRVEESEKAKLNREATSACSSRSETESALNLKPDDVENNRHSAMGAADPPAPPKPRRTTAQEPAQLVLPPALSSPPTEPTESNAPQSAAEAEEAAPQSWLHSMQSSAASSRKPETETPEEETVSLGSSTSAGSSLPDQGYAASEGMVEAEDSGVVSSPSDTQPTSPDGSLSLDGSSRGGRSLGPVRDNSSDSDEGCATWGSRHRHNDVSPQAKSGRLTDGYEDDPELTAQLHQTLAEFEADLADHIDVVSSRDTPYTVSTGSNEVPVSVVDMDVPVTAIDEVLEDYERHVEEHETKPLTRMEPAGRKGFCHKSSVEPQNQNNNACTAADSNKSSSARAKQPSQPGQHRKSLENKSMADKKEKKMLGTKMKETSTTDTNSVKEQRPPPAVKHSKRAEINPDPVKSTAPSFQEKKSVLPPSIQRSVSAERDEETHRAYQNNSNTTHGKITRNVTSRFGMKTFTVVPPKPGVTHAAAGEPAVKLTVGAIKIDDQGNMVKGGTSWSRVGGSSESGINSSEGSPLLGKAKAFWSSNERQESSVPHSKDLIDKAKESADGLKSTPTAVAVTALKSSSAEDLKMRQNSFSKRAERAQPKEVVKEPVRKEERVEGESKISVSKNLQQPSNKPALPPPFLPDQKKDLSFLKLSRRTSSQYVASAITRYTPKHQTHPSAKPNSIPNVHDSSASLKSQAVGFQRSGRSITVNPQQPSRSSLSDDKENDSASKSNPPYPKRSTSYPEHVSDIQRDFGEVRSARGRFGSCIGSAKGSSNTLETETAVNKHVRSGGPAQNNTTASNDGADVKQVRLRSPSPAQSSPPHSSAKPPTAPETVSQSRTSNTSDATKAASHPTQPSVTVSDTGVAPGPPPPVTLFGPVQKFRPVISRSVEKDTSLHGSLMEAIQTGGGRDRLRKITTSGLSSMKKSSYVEEEDERSALLAAIRAQSSSGRLRKTKSEAADELVKFRKVTSERAAGPPPPPPPSFTGTSPPVFTPPPPPAIVAPPPPPPVLPQAKPSTVAHPGANSPANPALAREAMLEAIRSGSASERLKKVAAPTTTVQVNGRLGTIQATSSALPRQ